MKGRGEEDNDGVGRQDTCASNWDAGLTKAGPALGDHCKERPCEESLWDGAS